MSRNSANRLKRRQGQAMNIAMQIIIEASRHNHAVSAIDVSKIVSRLSRKPSRGEFKIDSMQSWKKFLSMGIGRSLWNRERISVPSSTGSKKIFYYFHSSHCPDLDNIKYGTFPELWIRTADGQYKLELRPEVLNIQTKDVET